MQVKPLSVVLTFIAPGPRTEYRSSINICTTNEWILKSTIWREARKYQALVLRCRVLSSELGLPRGVEKIQCSGWTPYTFPVIWGGGGNAHIFPFIRQIWSENWVRQSYLPEAGVIRAGMAGKEKPGPLSLSSSSFPVCSPCPSYPICEMGWMEYPNLKHGEKQWIHGQ